MAASSIISLTSAQENQSKYVLYTTPVDSSRGLSINFKFYAYGGNPFEGSGGDGIGFFFVNGAGTPTQAGGFGGSLGYAPYVRDGISTPGIKDGYLGVGFDAFGNFSDPAEGRIGGPGGRRDSIAVRGSQLVGYQYLAGTNSTPDNVLPISIDSIAREERTARINLSPTGDLTVAIDLNNDGDTIDSGEEVIKLNVVNAGNGALPSTFKFGFAASTGRATNIHEVGNFDVKAFDGTPIPGSFTENLLIVGGGGTSGSGGTSGGGTSGGGTSSGGPGDVLTGGGGNDIIIGTPGTDVVTGGGGGDRFVFSGLNKRAALKTSTLRNLDRVIDFRFSEGDRLQLDFDGNLDTPNRPKRLFNAGKLKGNLRKAARLAYEDKNFKKKGDQSLKPNEAVLFRVGSRTYLSVNDNQRAFSPQNDFLVNVTGMELRPGDFRRGALAVGNYFV